MTIVAAGTKLGPYEITALLMLMAWVKFTVPAIRS